MTIRQMPASGSADISDHIDLTPAPPINDYTNVGPNGEVLDPEPVRKKPPPPKKPPRPPEMMNGSELYDDAESLPKAKPRPRPKPSELKRRSCDPTAQSHDTTAAKVGVVDLDDLYGNFEVEKAVAIKDRISRMETSNEYEDADSLDKMLSSPPVKSYTPAGTYDNPDEIIGSFVGGRVDNVYDTAEANEGELYDDVTSNEQNSRTPMSPKFDDVIYMKQGDSPVHAPAAPMQKPPLMKKPPTTRKPPVPAFRNMSKIFSASVVVCAYLSLPLRGGKMTRC